MHPIDAFGPPLALLTLLPVTIAGVVHVVGRARARRQFAATLEVLWDDVDEALR